jgi:hypothetical protein
MIVTGTRRTTATLKDLNFSGCTTNVGGMMDQPLPAVDFRTFLLLQRHTQKSISYCPLATSVSYRIKKPISVKL